VRHILQQPFTVSPNLRYHIRRPTDMAGAGRTAAKVLGINLDYRKEEPLSGAASISSVETCEQSPLTCDSWLMNFKMLSMSPLRQSIFPNSSLQRLR
jgi:hypothetical protein